MEEREETSEKLLLSCKILPKSKTCRNPTKTGVMCTTLVREQPNPNVAKRYKIAKCIVQDDKRSLLLECSTLSWGKKTSM